MNNFKKYFSEFWEKVGLIVSLIRLSLFPVNASKGIVCQSVLSLSEIFLSSDPSPQSSVIMQISLAADLFLLSLSVKLKSNRSDILTRYPSSLPPNDVCNESFDLVHMIEAKNFTGKSWEKSNLYLFTIYID